MGFSFNPLLGEIRVTRFVSVFDTGNILNPKMVRSPFIGGITFGIGMAFMEKTVSDPYLGRFVSTNLADHIELPVSKRNFSQSLHIAHWWGACIAACTPG